ncbi:MAG: hypothetical protein BECKG1743D_GA0114223_107282 [Candidatus Kentron sp. G]|nr:MAG: hypothetical protein BECKG1743E_GA0114224_106742 [Candidatus Kentron sp. G]VFN05510.1 MAG: hypothetical protein BECKG1743D_GA0114223_107282 [Candidatus Kentron sp. G]
MVARVGYGEPARANRINEISGPVQESKAGRAGLRFDASSLLFICFYQYLSGMKAIY